MQTALQEIQSSGTSLRAASRKYNIPVGTLSNKMKKKHMKNAGHPTVFSEEEQCFVEHIQVVGEWGFPFSLLDLRMMAQTYLNSIGKKIKIFNENVPTSAWAKKFLKRHESEL